MLTSHMSRAEHTAAQINCRSPPRDFPESGCVLHFLSVPRRGKSDTLTHHSCFTLAQEVTDCLDIDSQIASAMPSVLIGARGEEEDEEDEEECPPAPPPPPPSLRVLFVDIDHAIRLQFRR